MTQASAPITILLVEDNPGDARLVREMLWEDGGAAALSVTLADRLDRALELLAVQDVQVVLLDLSLPDSHGLDTLARMRAAAPDVPIVVLTGLADETMALKAVQGGAQDYLVKGRGDGEMIRRSIAYAIERFRSDKALRRSETELRTIFEGAAIGIAVADDQGRIIKANPAIHRMLGYEADELLGRSVLEITHPEDHAHEVEQVKAMLAGRIDSVQLEKRYLKKCGAVMWGRLTISVVRDPLERPLLRIGMIEDVTERRRMEEGLRLAAQVLENTSEGVFVTDAEHRIIHVNPAFTTLTGFTAEDVLGRKPSILSSGRHGRDFYERLWGSLRETGKWQGEIWNRRKSGELFAEWLNISVVRNAADEVINYVAVFSDITSRKQTEERLNYQANHDPLTNLPNRTLFHERLSRALARANRNHLTVAVMFLDLDRFKEINDTHGHLVGDMLLQAVAERLTNCTRQGDTVARLAGDEFVVILEDITDFRDSAIVAQKILHTLGEPYQLNGHRLSITTSIGISLYPADGEDIQTLVRNADSAMYRAKKQGKNAYQFASEDLNAQAFERLALESSLRLALERGEFELFYQPVYDLASGAIVAAEALLRWRHPDVGLVVPAQFLPVAEETGLILPIGRWVLTQACAQARAWSEAGWPDLRLTVNLSQYQLQQLDLVETIAQAVRRSGLRPGLLELELPEGAVMGRPQEHGKMLEGLRALGVRIAIDDFGTGYSSFGNLRRLPIDVLKIDQSFVRDIMTDADDAKIITAITAIAHSLRLTVVAEGVETAEQLAFLRRQQCDLAQGFFFSRPLPADEFTRLLAARAPLTA